MLVIKTTLNPIHIGHKDCFNSTTYSNIGYEKNFIPIYIGYKDDFHSAFYSL